MQVAIFHPYASTMPEEILVLFIFAMFTMMVLTGMTFRHRRKSKEIQSGSGGSSLTTSELERLMRRAVDEGTEPLRQSIEDLEHQLAELTGQKALPPAERRELLDLGTSDAEEEIISTTSVPRRSQSR